MKSIQEEEHNEKMMSQISNNSRSLTTQQIAILSHKNEIKKLTLNRSELVDDLHAFKKCKNLCNISDSALIKERELIQKTENLKYSSGSTTSSFSEKNIKDSNEELTNEKDSRALLGVKEVSSSAFMTRLNKLYESTGRG